MVLGSGIVPMAPTASISSPCVEIIPGVMSGSKSTILTKLYCSFKIRPDPRYASMSIPAVSLSMVPTFIQLAPLILTVFRCSYNPL